MNEGNSRPDPDALLARIQAEEVQQARGRMKIFMGYAAGVGKTYSMLEAAWQRKSEGIDVVAGYIETHGRLETEALLEGLEILPRKRSEYQGVILTEMDIDALLERHPQLALVDELAHTNAPGGRHNKRYQDVEELLAAGIDVYTTLNIQHLESLKDVIAQITGITVRETIPDSVIDLAAEIEVIDLPPEELLVRLREGKVYVPEQAARAMQKFFRMGNLTALRELVLRRAAERVDNQMRAYMTTKAIPGPWPATERLLVCIGPSPMGERLVRSTRRLADELKAEWVAVYVEIPKQLRLPVDQRERIAKALLLAEELGGKPLILPGNSISETVMKYARQHNFTKVIVGKPLRPASHFFRRNSLVDQLIQQSGYIDIYVVSGVLAATPKPAERWQPKRSIQRYLWGLLLVALGTFMGSMVQGAISPTNLVMVYLLAVVIAAAYLGRGPSIMVSLLGVLAFDYFFIEPYLTFVVSDTEFILTFIGLFGVGLVISELTARVRDQAEAALRREAELTTLYAMSRDLAVADGLDQILRAAITNVSQTFGREVVVYLPNPEGGASLKPYTHNAQYTPDENELAVAVWTFQHGQQAGRGTDTLSASDARYLPLKSAQGVVGVLGVKPKDPSLHLSPDQRRLLEAFASQAALALERAQLAEQARQAHLLQATERLQTALLSSISHDLRTPLVTIIGALSTLGEHFTTIEQENRRSLIAAALEEANRLNRLVGNLLSMTRLEAGGMQMVKEPTDLQDLVGTALEQVSERLDERLVSVDIPDSLPFVALDYVLIVQVLVNLLDNAIKYSSPDSPIEIKVQEAGAWIEVHVTDRGPGIPPDDLERVFDNFYRVHRPGGVSGTGLGLSICKGIVEAHGGTIQAKNRPSGGTRIIMRLPIEASSKQDLYIKPTAVGR